MALGCANCGEILGGAYCQACGQKVLVDADRRLAHLLGQFLAAATDVDGRFWRSLRALLFQPGRLSRDYLDGRRRYWMAPMTLFLLANLLYFVLPASLSDFNLPLGDQVNGQPHSVLTAGWVEQRIAARDAALSERWKRLPAAERPERPAQYRLADYARAYNARAGDVGKALIVVHVPFLALGLWLLFRRRRAYFAEHLVVATHMFTVLLLFLQLVLLPGEYLYAALGFPREGVIPWGVLMTSLALMHVHFALALRRSYDARWWLAVLVPPPLLFLMMMGSLYVYRTLQFLITYAIT